MPCRTKLKNAAIAARSAALPKIPDELIDQFVTGPMTVEAVNTASMAFKKALIERAMGAELGHHLGYPAGAAKPEAGTNQRNGRRRRPRDTTRPPTQTRHRPNSTPSSKGLGARSSLRWWVNLSALNTKIQTAPTAPTNKSRR